MPEPDAPPPGAKTDSSSVRELAAAMTALGLYTGENTEAEHAAEMARLGIDGESYRLRLVYALLGGVQTEAIQATGEVGTAALPEAASQQRITAGVEDHAEKLMEFVRFQVLTAATPLREAATRAESGPLVLAAAHAAEALQRLVGVCAAGHTLNPVDDRDPAGTAEMLSDELTGATEGLQAALSNVGIFRGLLEAAGF
jgi:ribosomal protein L12E/L44/L45/RPP1/RPP2